MHSKLTIRFLFACLALLPLVMTSFAQESERPEQPKAPAPGQDRGYDRPTTYPEIRFGRPAPAAERNEADEPAPAGRSRVFLVDVSDAMAASITLSDSRETTRLEHMRSLVEGGLDFVARRHRHFNVITFGRVQDFAGGGELLETSAENTRRAKEWLQNLHAEGRADLYSLLKECYAQGPETAVLLVGSMPVMPPKVSEEDIEKAGGLEEFIIEAVKGYRSKGSKTTLDITGIGLGVEERKFYERLAKAAGGTYLDG
jgi:hypothetical protein